MQEYTLATREPTNTPQQQVTRILHEVAGAIVDGETGTLLEYRHLSKHPKYEETWKHFYGNKIGGMLG